MHFLHPMNEATTTLRLLYHNVLFVVVTRRHGYPHFVVNRGLKANCGFNISAQLFTPAFPSPSFRYLLVVSRSSVHPEGTVQLTVFDIAKRTVTLL